MGHFSCTHNSITKQVSSVSCLCSLWSVKQNIRLSVVIYSISYNYLTLLWTESSEQQGSVGVYISGPEALTVWIACAFSSQCFSIYQLATKVANHSFSQQVKLHIYQ